MPNKIIAIFLLGLFFSVEADDSKFLEKKAKSFLQNYCWSCHGEGITEGGLSNIADLKSLIKNDYITPYSLEKSYLWQRVSLGEMPPEEVSKRPSTQELAELKSWIESGAVVSQDSSPSVPENLGQAIWEDCQKINPSEKIFTRYFYFGHLKGEIDESYWKELKPALEFVLNHLSLQKEMVLLDPVNTDLGLYRLNLRKLGWKNENWRTIEAQYPLTLPSSFNHFRNILAEIRTKNFVLFGDWAIKHLSSSPLYEELLFQGQFSLDLRAPNFLTALEQALGLSRQELYQQMKVVGAGTLSSGVAINKNRIIARMEIPRGLFKGNYYWISYDFSQGVGRQNIFASPLGPFELAGVRSELIFEAAGSEVIFSLPNGLQGYAIANNQGQYLPAAPINIVADPKRADKTVKAAVSCMQCHAEGIIPKSDQVRERISHLNQVEQKYFDSFYIEQEKFHSLQLADAQKFQKAAQAFGNFSRDGHPVGRFFNDYEKPLRSSQIARYFFLDPIIFEQKIRALVAQSRFNRFRPLAEKSVSRDFFEQNYQDLFRALEL